MSYEKLKKYIKTDQGKIDHENNELHYYCRIMEIFPDLTKEQAKYYILFYKEFNVDIRKWEKQYKSLTEIIELAKYIHPSLSVLYLWDQQEYAQKIVMAENTTQVRINFQKRCLDEIIKQFKMNNCKEDGSKSNT